MSKLSTLFSNLRDNKSAKIALTASLFVLALLIAAFQFVGGDDSRGALLYDIEQDTFVYASETKNRTSGLARPVLYSCEKCSTIKAGMSMTDIQNKKMDIAFFWDMDWQYVKEPSGDWNVANREDVQALEQALLEKCGESFYYCQE